MAALVELRDFVEAVIRHSTVMSSPGEFTPATWALFGFSCFAILCALGFVFRKRIGALAPRIRRVAEALRVPQAIDVILPLIVGMLAWGFLELIGLTHEGPPVGLAFAVATGLAIVVYHRRERNTARRQLIAVKEEFDRFLEEHDPWLKTIDEIMFPVPHSAHGLVADLIEARLADMRSVVEKLFDGGYEPDPPGAMAAWFAFFFSRGGDRYVGIDSHLPNDYLEEYAWYLSVHEKSLKERKERALQNQKEFANTDERVIVSTAGQLKDSFHDPKGSYAKFVKWHEDNQVKLYWVATPIAEQLRKDCQLPPGTDVSLWEHHAVMFTPRRRPRRKTPGTSIVGLTANPFNGAGNDFSLQMVVGDDDSSRSVNLLQAQRFERLIREHRTLLGYSVPPTSIVDNDLVSMWEPYLAPRERLRKDGPLASLLAKELSGRTYVLDSAAGIGAESVFLIQELRKVVTINEVDKTFRAALMQYATRHSLKCTPLDGAWEVLSEEFNDGTKFEAILCIGNSMCLVESDNGRQLAFANFHELLKADGILIIDERNFEYMLQRREEILRHPLDFPGVHEDPMYKGIEIRGMPVEIEDTRVEWSLFRLPPEGDQVTMADIKEEYSVGQSLDLVPFRFGQLARELELAGLEVLRTYVDLEQCYDGLPPLETAETAQFFTYIVGRCEDVANSRISEVVGQTGQLKG